MSSARDPLNEILLPAEDLAKKIQHGEVSARTRDKLLAAAVLVLMAERDSYAMLLDQLRQDRATDRQFIAALKDEADPAAVDRAIGLLRLHRHPETAGNRL